MFVKPKCTQQQQTTIKTTNSKSFTLVTFERVVYLLNMHPKYEVSIISKGLKDMAEVKVFRHVGQRPFSRLLGQIFLYQWKGLITRNVHMLGSPLTVQKLW